MNAEATHTTQINYHVIEDEQTANRKVCIERYALLLQCKRYNDLCITNGGTIYEFCRFLLGSDRYVIFHSTQEALETQKYL